MSAGSNLMLAAKTLPQLDLFKVICEQGSADPASFAPIAPRVHVSGTPIRTHTLTGVSHGMSRWAAAPQMDERASWSREAYQCLPLRAHNRSYSIAVPALSNTWMFRLARGFTASFVQFPLALRDMTILARR